MKTIQIEKSLEFRERRVSYSEIEEFVRNNPDCNPVLAGCPCRTFTEDLDKRECSQENPVGACIFTGAAARHLEESGVGSAVNGEKLLKYVHFMMKAGLEAKSDIELNPGSVICFCCGCCCSHMKKEFLRGGFSAEKRTELIYEYDKCTLCGICVRNCPVLALEISFRKESEKGIMIDKENCIKCGICVFVCPDKAMKTKGLEYTDNRTGGNL